MLLTLRERNVKERSRCNVIFKKWISRYRKWKEWRKYTWMGPVRQLLVLFNLVECTWFDEFIPGKYEKRGCGAKVVRPWEIATDSVVEASMKKGVTKK
jgi:hypothetical protein